MSTTIDEKVVEMRFDNAQFERNVNQSISSLEKLKRSLNLKGAAKNLERIEADRKKIDFSSAGRSVDVFKNKFSALEKVATGALLKIGSTVADLGMKIANTVTSMGALNFDNIAAGWEKFGQKSTSVGTLVAQGYALEEVNNQLERLNWYTDETSYNFTDMVNNISKFTAAGQDLTTSVTAMEGIANWAALSGQNAVTASRAMAQLSQAMSKGVLKYDDWRSIQNANMDTIEFRRNAVQMAVDLKMLKQVGDDSFQTLQGHVYKLSELFTSDALSRDGWFNSKVMMGTFSKYAAAIDQIYDYAQQKGITASEAIEALGGEVNEFGLKAFRAAQEARTWADVVASVKDAVSTGWMKTFELIIGDYEEAKTFFTNLANDFYNIFAESGNIRNNLLFDALSPSYDRFAKSISDLATELKGLSDVELEEKGYTREQAAAIDELNNKIKAGLPNLEEYINDITKPSGRQNLAQSIYNIYDALFKVDEESHKAVGVIAVIKKAWAEVFPPMTAEQIYHITEVIRDFTASLIPTEERADQLKRTFKGLFSILDIVKQAFSAVFRVLKSLFGGASGFGDTVFETSAAIGDWLSNLSDLIKKGDVFYTGLQRLINLIKMGIGVIEDFGSAIATKLNLPTFEQFSNSISGFFTDLQGKFSGEGLGKLSESLENGVSSLKDFIKSGKDLSGSVTTMEDFAKWTSISGLNIQEAQEAFKDYSKNVSTGFQGISATFSKVKTNVTNTVTTIIQALKEAKDKIFEFALDIRSKLTGKIGFSEMFAVGFGAAMVAFTKRISDAFMLIASPLEGLGKVLKSTSKLINAFAMKTKSEALINVAKAILMLVGALAALALLDSLGVLKSSATALAILAASLVGITIALTKLTKNSELAISGGTLLAFAAAILILAGAMKKIADINLDQSVKSFLIIEGLLWSMLAVSKLIGSKNEVFSAGALSMIAFAASIKMMVGALKQINNLQLDDPLKIITILGSLIGGLAVLSLAANQLSLGSGFGVLAIVISLKLVVQELKELCNMDMTKVQNGLSLLGRVFLAFAVVVASTNIAGEYALQAGGAILAMSASLLIIVKVLKLMEKLDPNTLDRSVAIVSGLLLVFSLVTAMSHYSGESAAKAGVMILAMSGAMMLIAVAMTVLSHLVKTSAAGFNKALSAITQLLLVFGAIVAITGYAGKGEEVRDTLLQLNIMIALLAGSIAVLSLLDPGQIETASRALSMVVAAFGLLVAASKNATKSYKSLWNLVGVMAAIGTILTVMAKIPNAQASIKTASAIAIVLAAISASLYVLNDVDKLDSGVGKDIWNLVGVVTAIGAIFTIMAGLKVEASISNAFAISVVLEALAGAMWILSNAEKIADGVMGSTAILLSITLGIAAILGILAGIKVEASIQTANAISTLLLALSASVWILSNAGSVSASALTAAGVLTLVIGALALMLSKIVSLDVESSLATAASLSVLLISLSIACAILGVAGQLGTAGLVGIVILIALVAAMGGLMALISAITKDNPTVEEDLDRAISVLEKIGSGLGGVIGGFISEFVGSGITGLLSDLGTGLSEFMTNSQPFLDGLKGISSDMLTGATNLAGIYLALTAADFVASIPTIQNLWNSLTGQSKFDKFGDELVSLGDALEKFTEECDLDEHDIAMIAKTGKAVQAFADLSNSIPNNGFVTNWFSDHDLGDFGKQLAKFGEGLVDYSNAVSSGDGINIDAISTSVEGANMLVALAKSVPNMAVLANLFVKHDIGLFGNQLISFGTGLRMYSNAVSYEGGIDNDAIAHSVDTAWLLVDLAKAVPNTGGLWTFLTNGQHDVGFFGTQLAAFGRGLKQYSESVAGDNTVDKAAIERSIEIAKSLVGLTDIVPNTGLFSSEGSKLSRYIRSISAYPEALKEYGKSVAGMNDYLTDIRASINAGRSLSGLVDLVTTLEPVKEYFSTNTDFSTFATGISSFGGAIKAYCESIEGLEGLDESVQTSGTAGAVISGLAALMPNIKSLVDFFSENDTNFDSLIAYLVPLGRVLVNYGQAVSGIDSGSIAASVASIKSLAELQNSLTQLKEVFAFFGDDENNASFGTFGSDFAEFADQLRDADTTKLSVVITQLSNISKLKPDKVTEFGESLETLASVGLKDFVAAFSTAKTNVVAVVQDMLDTTIRTVRGYKDDFYSAGQYVAKGLADGIKDKQNIVNEAGKKLGLGVTKATESILEINSPSEVFIEIASMICKGLGIGIDNFSNIPIDSITDLFGGLLESSLDVVDGYSASDVLEKLFGLDNIDTLIDETNVVDQLTQSYNNATKAKNSYNAASAKQTKKAEVDTKVYYTGFTSDEYNHLMANLGEGLTVGFRKGLIKGEGEIADGVKEVTSIAEKGIDTWKDWLDNKKYYNKISLQEELAGWTKLQDNYKAGSKERQEIDREVYRVQNELASTSYQDVIKWIEEEEFYNRISTQQELDIYEELQRQYIEGSEERMEIDRKVYTLRNQLMDESYQHSMNWIEREKYYNRMTLAEELAAYKRVQSRYAKGTEEREKMDREVYRLEKEIYDAQVQYVADVQKVQQEANEKRVQLEQEYADKVREIEDKLASDIEAENNRYLDALESRTDALYSSYGLFDAVSKKEEVDSDTLMRNLQDQVIEFSEWRDVLDSLSERGVGDEFISELRQMGPSSIAQVKALQSMTDVELNKYVSLWSIKHAQARTEAISELESLRIETLQNIEELRIKADDELDEYRFTWDAQMRQLNRDTDKQLEELKISFMKTVGLIKEDTTQEMQEMADTANAILRNAGWTETGQYMVDGLIAGINSKAEEYVTAITNLALAGEEAYQETEEEHSPSRVFERLGQFTVLGLIKGLTEYSGKAYDAATKVAEYTKEGFADSMVTIADFLNSDVEYQPTIRPVLDLSDVSAGMGVVDELFYNRKMLALLGSTSYAFAANADNSSDMTINVDNDDVVQELRSLRSDMAEMNENITQMQIVLDSGAMVGALAGPMDEALGERAVYGRRGI